MRTCSVCKHERRVEIDRAIHAGLYSSKIGRRFNLSKPTVTGHRRSGHHLLQPRRVYTGPHTAESLLARIEESLGDPDALAALRVAASALPAYEKRLFIAELRRRSGRVAEHIPARLEVA